MKDMIHPGVEQNIKCHLFPNMPRRIWGTWEFLVVWRKSRAQATWRPSPQAAEKKLPVITVTKQLAHHFRFFFNIKHFAETRSGISRIAVAQHQTTSGRKNGRLSALAVQLSAHLHLCNQFEQRHLWYQTLCTVHVIHSAEAMSLKDKKNTTTCSTSGSKVNDLEVEEAFTQFC